MQSAAKWYSFDAVKVKEGVGQLLVIEDSDVDLLFRVTQGSEVVEFNPPYVRGVNTWLWVPEKKSTANSYQLQYRPSFDVVFSNKIKIKVIEVAANSAKYIKKFAETNLNWFGYTFDQKETVVADLAGHLVVNHDDPWHADGLVQLTWMYHELGNYQALLALLAAHPEWIEIEQSEQWH